jgi:signal transduction histidine kinase/DNA-binding response OmpR family regulator
MITALPNILIVDDIEVNLILLETALRKEQSKIYKAYSGYEALELTRQLEFALIILDVSMPVMNGFELAEHIRKEQLNAKTPIIFISAILFDEFSVSQGYRSGAVDYISKPYHHEVLLSKVRVFLELYNQKQEIKHHSTILQENNEKLKDIQETLKLRLQLQKAVSLASARFSGNFELSNSIHFMLRDIANVCGSSSATFLPAENNEAIGYHETNHSPEVTVKITPGMKSKLDKTYSQHQEAVILVSTNDINGPWMLPYKIDASSGVNAMTVAINVNSGENHYGYLFIHDCNGMMSWQASELNALSVFGTITGNALEKNKTRQELIESELRYRSYIENAPEGIVVTTNTGLIVEYNQAFAGMFSELTGNKSKLNILDLLKTQDLTSYSPVKHSLLNGKLSKGEFIVTVSGRQKVIKAESVKLPAKQYLIFCTDITNERDIEKHLIQTERMVAIGEMATGIAHEINQPLNTISFGIDNLFQALNTNKADATYIKDKSTKIFESIHRMRNIIDHVRNFARGNDDVILSNFFAVEPVENALSLYIEQFKNHGIEIVKNISPDAAKASVHGNTYKIEQVILNLLSNARDTMEEKRFLLKAEYQPSVTINAFIEENRFAVTVSDNGMGMTDEQLSNIMKPFVTGKAPGKGTGLGLAISQKIIAEHKGGFSFSSIPSEGTTAKIVLPLVVKESSPII